MIETKKEWKRALKGASIFIGSLVVLGLLLFFVIDIEPNKEKKISAKDTELTYTLEQQYKDYVSYNLIPIMKEEAKIIKEYNLLISFTYSEDTQKDIVRYGQQLEGIYPFMKRLLDREENLKKKVNSLSLPKDFPSEDVGTFQNLVKSYSDTLGYQFQFIQSVIAITENYQDSGLSFSDYVAKDTKPMLSFSNNNRFLIKRAGESSDDFNIYLQQMNDKYDLRISDLITPKKKPTPL